MWQTALRCRRKMTRGKGTALGGFRGVVREGYTEKVMSRQVLVEVMGGAAWTLGQQPARES